MSRYAANQKRQQKQREKASTIFFVPLMLLLSIVPLITRLKIAQASENVARTFKLQMTTDFFSYYKAIFIILIAIMMILIVFFTINKEDLKKYKSMLLYITTAGIFLLFTLLSTLFSSYKQEALWGVPGRSEGMLITFCYIMMMFYTIHALSDFKNYKYIIFALALLVGVLTFLGIFEYMGKNLLINTELGKRLLIPSEYAQYRNSLNVAYEKGKVYGTMFHYNYMGSFGALMVPIFATLTLCIKGRKEKIILGVLTMASLFLLFGSTSRGGLIGTATAVVIGLILFSKKIITNWKMTLPMIVTLSIVLIGFNILTKGTIFERIPSLLRDTMIGFTSADQDFNYLDEIPIKNITMQEGKVIITTQTDALVIAKEDTQLKLYDKASQEIPYIETDQEIILQDARFEGMILKKIVDPKSQWGGIMLNVKGVDTFVFKIDNQQGVYLIDSFTQEKVDIVYPETFGFKGKERLGSARGYIWSRSIPMLKDTWLLGHGPDTYAFEFPQHDYLGKYYAYETPNMIVDKPHNLYLQIGINQGGIALIAFLVLVIGYIADSLRLYALKSSYETRQVVGIATVLSIVGYLGAGLFNDSVVSVAPVFWILLGAGIAVNYLNRQQAQ